MKRNTKKFWLVYKFVNKNEFDIMGLFDNKSKAIKRCKSWEYGVGPLILNESLSDNRVEWNGAFYPISR